MANYNFNLAKQIINSSENLVKASLGMKEDWFWTAETIWKNGKFEQCFYEQCISGINGSYWATPILHLTFKDGSEKWFECYDGILGDSLERIEQEMNWANGVLSGPVQEYIDQQNIEPISKIANAN